MGFLGLTRVLSQRAHRSAARLGQRPRCVWLTGLPGAGKTTLARVLEQRLEASGHHACVLDGDDLRLGLCRDLGFSEADRIENIRRVAEVAKLMFDAGLVVIVALVSPFRDQRQAARGLFQDGEFIEVFVDAPREECERRDPKGMYAMARRGELPGFTGVDARYEAPAAPELHLRTSTTPVAQCVEKVLRRLE